jgi:hypothetical protein
MNITNHCHDHVYPSVQPSIVPIPPTVQQSAQVCPVCTGKGSVAGDFYPATEPNVIRRPDGRVVCKSCFGAGFVLHNEPAQYWPRVTTGTATWTNPPEPYPLIYGASTTNGT